MVSKSLAILMASALMASASSVKRDGLFYLGYWKGDCESGEEGIPFVGGEGDLDRCIPSDFSDTLDFQASQTGFEWKVFEDDACTEPSAGTGQTNDCYRAPNGFRSVTVHRL